MIGATQRARIVRGDCARVLRSLPDESVDALVTDPPAGIAVFGLEWDADKGGQAAWVQWLGEVLREVVRALKPGAHGWVWAYPRTAHWTAQACELAGLEIRDVAVHLFGYRMPKGIDVAKAIDAKLGVKPHVVGRRQAADLSGSFGMSGRRARRTITVTKPRSKLARQWAGWSTAIKQGSEHWILVRKPLRATVVDTVLELGTGALNVGACDLGGRQPSTVALQHVDTCSLAACDERCPAGALGEAGKYFYAHRVSAEEREAGCNTLPRRTLDGVLSEAGRGNFHAAVKPIALMRWLLRLVTPKGGLVLDPFAGSGSTGAAAMLEGARFLGIERDEAAVRVARARISYWRRKAGHR